MTNETTPDAVEQAIASLVNVLVNECSHTSETASALDVCLANLRHARHAERARHAEEMAEERRLKELKRQETVSLQGAVRKLMDQLEAEEARVASLRDQLRKVEGERAMWEKTASVLSGKLDSLRSLLPDVRACAVHCISCSRSGEATTEATERILAALDSRKDGE